MAPHTPSPPPSLLQALIDRIHLDADMARQALDLPPLSVLQQDPWLSPDYAPASRTNSLGGAPAAAAAAATATANGLAGGHAQ